MIDFYFYPTPNTWKVSIMLEECGLPYRVLPIDITRDEQFTPEFLAVSPNNRVPAIVDHDTGGAPQSVFESGAILIYLAEKTGRLFPASGPRRVATLEWLMWQVAHLGPMAGQAHHFRRYRAEGNEYAIERYTNEAARLYRVLERRLDGHEWLADEYSIADIACWGWVWFHRLHGQDLDDFPSVRRWFFAMSERPAVQRGKLLRLDLAAEGFRRALEGPFYSAPDDLAASETEVR
jgi:GST-like protein